MLLRIQDHGEKLQSSQAPSVDGRGKDFVVSVERGDRSESSSECGVLSWLEKILDDRFLAGGWERGTLQYCIEKRRMDRRDRKTMYLLYGKPSSPSADDLCVLQDE